MTNVERNIKSITKPPKDFLLSDEIFDNRRYARAVRDRIYSELFMFLSRMKGTEVFQSEVKSRGGKVKVSTSDYEYEVEIAFHRNSVEVFLNGKSIGESEIHGANINRETLSATNIKVDLASIKKELSNSIN